METKIRDQGRWKIIQNSVRHERSGVFQGRIDRRFSPYRLAGACRSHCETQNIAWRFRRATDRQVRRRPNPVPANRFEEKNRKMHDWVPGRCFGARVMSKAAELRVKSKRRMNARVEHPPLLGLQMIASSAYDTRIPFEIRRRAKTVSL